MSWKPLPPLPIPPPPPLTISPPMPNEGTSVNLEPMFKTRPQPHFHRIWFGKCLHLAPTVRIPFGEKIEGGEVVNRDRFCMCDDPERYYLEEIEGPGDFCERRVVEAFLGGVKGRGGIRGVIEKVRGRREEGRRVFRWVPRWRRVEGVCGCGVSPPRVRGSEGEGGSGGSGVGAGPSGSGYSGAGVSGSGGAGPSGAGPSEAWWRDV
ncbi:hypothetical protein TWF481_010559 [Arthrobotrys musiformis]|uniref:Uncharacterized protein n=1 Tax=Arthrobotrys musiformis TaxID=47236 RepID=A0AAV9W2I2_9PEZI